MRKNQILYISIISLFFFACKKDQAELSTLNKICNTTAPVSANFLIEEPFSLDVFESFQKYIPTDTAYANKNIQFIAVEDNASYTWYLGSELINEQSFKRHFSDDFIGETIEVSLVVKKKPNLICFPNDDGYDSITKYFYLLEKTYSNPIDFDSHLFKGNFRFKDSLNPNSDSIDVNLSYNIEVPPTAKPSSLQVLNLFGNNESLKVEDTFYFAYRYLYMKLPTKGMDFRILHTKEGLVTILLEDIFDENKPVHYLKGRKLK